MPGRGVKSIKPDPNQPTLRSTNSNPRRLSTERPNNKSTPTESKRKRRSTGDRRAAKRTRELELKKTVMPPTAEQTENHNQESTKKMSNQDGNPAPASNDTIQEIRNMEARLKGNRKTELEELEANLTNSMKKLLDKSMEDALKKLNTNISNEISKHPTIHQHTTELVQLKAENTKLNQQLIRLDNEFSKLRSKISDMEQKTLDKSVIMRGIRESNGETESSLREQIYRILSNTIEGPDYDSRLIVARKMTIRRCKRLGRYNKQRARAVSIEFDYKEDVEYILENKGYLGYGVFVDLEYTGEIEYKRRLLMPLLRAAKQHDHLKTKCRMEEDKLIIKGKPYTTANLHELPPEINVFSATTREDDSTIAFFGALNPLSNFYEAEFTINGVTYISSEQYIQAMKSLHFKDNATYNLIMGSTNSLDCKINGSKVKNFRKEEWDNKAKDECRPGIHAKFQQNPNLFQILCEKTSNKTIVESARDRVWGTGTTLGSPDCLNRDRWVTQGILGELLEEVRACQHQRSLNSGATGNPIATEPIANKMLTIANYPQVHPSLQPPPPPFPGAGVYPPHLQVAAWPTGPPSNYNAYQYGYTQPKYPTAAMQPTQPVIPPLGADTAQQVHVTSPSSEPSPLAEPKQATPQIQPTNQDEESMST